MSFQTIATLGKEKDKKMFKRQENLAKPYHCIRLNVIKDGPIVIAVNVSLSLLPWIKVVGLELYITFTFLYCKTPPRRAKEKGKFAGHLSFVAKQPCGSVN